LTRSPVVVAKLEGVEAPVLQALGTASCRINFAYVEYDDEPSKVARDVW
jgi:hypothetical protein